MIINTPATLADKKAMPVSKLGQRRQVVIPKSICEELNLETGDFIEVKRVKGTVVLKPKKLVDADDTLTQEEEALVRKGEGELKEGKSHSWKNIKHDMDL